MYLYCTVKPQNTLIQQHNNVFYFRKKFIFLLLRNLCKVNKTLDEQFYTLLILKVKKIFLL